VPDNVPDQAKLNRAIDELQMDAIDEHQQYLAALTVCAEMDRMGSSQEEVREVLAALDLLRVADGRRSRRRSSR
jgi:hypothetical protein